MASTKPNVLTTSRSATTQRPGNILDNPLKGKASMGMMTQYFLHQQALEEKYGKKSLVLMMVGSFYEAYSFCTPWASSNVGNVEEIGKIFGTVVTRRNKEKSLAFENPHMCGFPAGALPRYLSKLLQHKYTIAQYDQFDSEDPRQEKERKLTHLYSPSTYVTEELHTNNILMSIFIDDFICPITNTVRLYCSTAYIDLSTGKNSVNEFLDDQEHPFWVKQELLKLLYCIDPSEILLMYEKQNMSGSRKELVDSISKEYDDKLIHNLPKDSKFSDTVYQETFINKIFHCKDGLEKIGLNHSGDLVQCYIQLLQFAYEHDPHIVDKISLPQQSHQDGYLYLNHDAMCELNLLNKNKDQGFSSIFRLVNKTNTMMGERLLKSRLLRPITDINELENRYGMIEIATPLTKEYGEMLKSIIDIEKRYRKIVMNNISIGEFASTIPSLELMKNIFLYRNNLFKVNESIIKGVSKSITYIKQHFNISVLEKYEQNTDTYHYIFNKGVYVDLDHIYEKIVNIENIFAKLIEELKYFGNQNNIRANLSIVFDKQGKCNIITTKRAWQNLQKHKWSTQINYIGSEKPLVFRLEDLQESMTTQNNQKLSSRLLDKLANILYKLTQKITTYSDKYFKNFLTDFDNKFNKIILSASINIAKIDVAVSSATIASKFCYRRPILIDNKVSSVEIKNLRHPLIERIQDNNEYIGNDLSFNSKNIGMLLYGLNSSGKSSLLRSLGVNIILAQAGLFTSTDSMTLTPYTKLFTKISAADNLFKGQSTFIVEMYCLRDILQQADQKSMILCDELTAGTEIDSATGIVAGAINTLVNQNAHFLFTTHLHSLVQFQEISKNNKINIYHFSIETNSQENTITFNRKLQKGSGEHQYGIEIADVVGLPKKFIKKAYEFRTRHQGFSTDFLSNKRSRYNGKVIIDTCTICNHKPTDKEHLHVHHINEQHTADQSGIIQDKSFHKNIRHNLMVLCEKCHHDIHARD